MSCLLSVNEKYEKIMYLFHYPGLESINERLYHWELNLPIEKLQTLYPKLDRWPNKINTKEEYISKRERYVKNLNVKSFLHFWYIKNKQTIWSETADYICDSKSSYTPIALVWCWKTPHFQPLINCFPHNIKLRSSEREVVNSYDDIKYSIKLLANKYFSSRNYYKINNRPVIYFYHIEGWLEMCSFSRNIFNNIREEFYKYNLNPYMVGISVTNLTKFEIGKVKTFDAISRYNDLPDFTNYNTQDFQERTRYYINNWDHYCTVLKKEKISFIPTISIGWDASMRFKSKNINEELTGYPLTPIVTNNCINKINWAMKYAKNKINKLDINCYSICAWNEWLENASLEYYLKFHDFQVG